MARLFACAVVAALLVTVGVSPVEARSKTAGARAQAAKGSRLFQQGKNDQAITAFQAAYDLKPHYLMQCNIARCHESSGRHTEAARHYRRCLDEGGDRAPVAGEVRKALAEAERKGDVQEDPPPQTPSAPVGPLASPFLVSLSLGPAMELHEVPSQFKLAAGFGYHFSGSSTGPALGGEIQLGFVDFVSVVIGARFSWDLLLAGPHELGFILSPRALLGFAHLGELCVGRFCGVARNGLSLQLGVEGRLLLARRFYVSFQPIGIDLLITANGDTSAGLRYDLMLGGGMIF